MQTGTITTKNRASHSLVTLVLIRSYTVHLLHTTQQHLHKHSSEPTRADMVSAGRPSSLSDVVNLAADCHDYEQQVSSWNLVHSFNYVPAKKAAEFGAKRGSAQLLRLVCTSCP